VAIEVELETFLTRDEAADLLGVSVRSVDRLRARGRLSAVQFLRRGRVRYRRDDVESLLEPEAREPLPAREDELLWR
jgi:excisionase family DNA binding protein